MNYKLFFTLLLLLGWSSARAQSTQSGATQQWAKVATGMPEEWYGTDEAKQIAENVLLYQRPSGGWPKNIVMQRPLTEGEKYLLKNGTRGFDATLDNDATTLEMRFMASVYRQTGDKRYRDSFEKGLRYLFEAQYDNGGWPQFYPLREGYYTHITFNDDAMSNILKLLREVYERQPQFGFVGRWYVARAREAFDKGIECILRCQIYVDGEPTVWCAQHNEVTLAPDYARTYELPSFSGLESTGLTLMLMSIEDPSPEIVRAVEGAVAWFEAHKIPDIKLETHEPDGSYNRHIVAVPGAPAMWARFYDLETGKPFFCGRDGIKKANMTEIEYERRNGYSWYNYRPQQALDAYPTWKERVKGQE